MEAVGVGTKAGARAGVGGPDALVGIGGAPFGRPRDLGRRASSPLLYEVATESWLMLLTAIRCLREASCALRFLFESMLWARLAGDELPLGAMGLRDGVRA